MQKYCLFQGLILASKVTLMNNINRSELQDLGASFNVLSIQMCLNTYPSRDFKQQAVQA